MLTEESRILEDIFTAKRAEVERTRRICPLSVIQDQLTRTAPPLDFIAAIRRNRMAERSREPNRNRMPALIAEVKHRSPSRGLLSRQFDPLKLAQIYRDNGAAAMSILTDEPYFGGHLDHLRQIALFQADNAEHSLPLLRKDFILDPYQVYEARAAGADAVLLIVAGLKVVALHELFTLVRELGMAPLVEVHSPLELEIALSLDPPLIGINNRNLHDFRVTLETTEALWPLIPAEVCIVSESGIHSAADARRIGLTGVDAILVGEALVSAVDVAGKVRELAGIEGNSEP